MAQYDNRIGGFGLSIGGPKIAARISEKLNEELAKTPKGIAAAAAKRKLQEFEQLKAEQAQQQAELLRGFRTSSELAAARQLGQLEAGVGTFTQRAGIGGSELAASLAARERGQLAAQTLGAQQDFGVKLSLAQADSRNRFLEGKFGFFDALAKANYQAALERDLAAFQAQIQQDQASWGQWLKIADTAASVISLL